MTWYAIFQGSPAATQPISIGNVIAAPGDASDAAAITRLTASGFTVVTLAGNPAGSSWDEPSQTFIANTPALLSITTLQFMRRFTAAEFLGLHNSPDANVQFFLFQATICGVQISPGDQTIQNFLTYAVSIGLLTAARALVIGAH